jgi:hypothetical protein
MERLSMITYLSRKSHHIPQAQTWRAKVAGKMMGKWIFRFLIDLIRPF